MVNVLINAKKAIEHLESKGLSREEMIKDVEKRKVEKRKERFKKWKKKYA